MVFGQQENSGIHSLKDCSIDALVAHVAVTRETLSECFRVMKPGAHATFCDHPTTAHKTATQLEDCKFEIRDVITSIGKQKKHWILARKPLEGTVAENVLKWGCGGIHITAARIPYASDKDMPQPSHLIDFRGSNFNPNNGDKQGRTELEGKDYKPNLIGRWPSNLTFSHDGCSESTCTQDCTIRKLDEQNSQRLSKFFFCTHEPLVNYLIKLIVPENGTLFEVKSA